MAKYQILLFFLCALSASAFFTSSSQSKHERSNHRNINIRQEQEQRGHGPFKDPMIPSRRQISPHLHQHNNNNNNARGGSQLFNRKILLKVFAGAVVSIPLALEGYANCGSVLTDCSLDAIQSSNDGEARKSSGNGDQNHGSITTNTEDVTFIFHGAGGQDANTDELLQVLRKGSRTNSSFIKMIDWSQDSADILQASVKGSKIGEALGKQLARFLQTQDTANVQNVHIIGISVGAFPANGLVQALDATLRPSLRKNINLQLTLLDPFQQKAVLGFRYGKNNFGKGCDYAQQYLNTDDPVPSTNDSLPYCATTDVTSLRPSEIFGHDWPLIYYSNELRGKKNDEAAGGAGDLAMVPIGMRKKIGETVLM